MSSSNNKDDLTNIIKDMAMEYLKPKHPIYRLEYIHSLARDDGDTPTCECITHIRTVVVEVIDDANKDASHYNPHSSRVIFQGDFMEDGRIDTKLLPVLLAKKGTVMRCSDYDETWVFTKIERLG